MAAEERLEDKMRPWVKLLGNGARMQGVLQEKRPGEWRLRWRERDDNDCLRHCSRRVPPEYLYCIKEMMKVLGNIRNGERSRKRKRIRDLSAQYRQERRMVMSGAAGGRISKRAAVELYDMMVRDARVPDASICRIAQSKQPLKRGRPRKTLSMTY